MSRPTMRIRRRGRLVLASFVVALVALTTALALAQEHVPAGDHARAPGHAVAPPAGHGAAGTPAAHGETAGTQHGEPAAAGEHAEHPEHAGGGHHGPEALNWTDIWDKRRPAILALVINFGVLLTLYYMLGKKPIAEGLTQRRVTIGKDIDEAQKLLDEAKERAKKYQGDLKNVDADASTAKAALISSGKGEVDHLLTEAEERADRMKRDAERLVQQERKQIRQDLLVETVELSVVEAAQILEKTVTADDHARLAQDLLAELSRRPSAKAASSVPSGGAS
jgi:F-type H+-transporting ATPase subunit b